MRLNICMYYLTPPPSSRRVLGALADAHFNSELNALVMDYLVIGGYKTAAELFAREADVSPPVDLQSIESRMCIREALQRGDVQDAITRVNDLNPEVRVFSIRSGQDYTSHAPR